MNEEHQAAFEAARADHRRGGSLANNCGAKTRGGAACKLPPLKGHSRCLRHAGPKAARQHREYQLKQVALGRLELAIFEAAEQRRAANRQRWLWKKLGPWESGSTISLGVHEDGFTEALRAMGYRADSLPPGIADAFRWKYRRFMVDRSQPAEWRKVVEGLDDHIRAAGESPENFIGEGHCTPSFRTPHGLSPFSRRRILNPRRSEFAPLPKAGHVNHEALPMEDPYDLNSILIRHRAELTPVLSRCETAEDRLRVAASYKRILAEPADLQARRDWMALLQELGI
ncbi:hypothetical protein ACFSM9_09795 [Microvirga arabica]|uniref:hypothetical protein n=1 Tax=Microvirga arabica TaxID=1128671 RepID=UPI0019395FBD|nr:hypothetical protein [Microvirga arabica]